jgi:hypothetical protein
MPRLKRAQKTDWPGTLAPVLVPGRLRVLATFTCEGRLFSKGEIVMLDEPLVQRIAAEYPGVFERASTLVPPS